MLREQGTGFLQSWGGPDTYRVLATLPEPTRLTYEAVLGGSTTASEIEVVTGLTGEQISRALSTLSRKKLVDIEEVE